ncbi:MAG: CopG family transcriptional regulator [Lentisphaeraceae bacterium]|nr:CopG family transcriptional regulator [Lentisphaeraceae bacterium]
MTTMNKRTTIYFDPKLHKLLKAKSLESEKSISELVDLAVRHELLEDLDDIRDYEERKNGSFISYKELLSELEND